MSCRGWNPHIALYVEGDLDRDMALSLESHLSTCVECRSFAETLRATQAEMRQLRNEAIAASSLSRVRASVLQQVRAIEQQRTWMDRAAIWLWGGFRYRYAVLGCAAVVLTAAMMWQVSRSPVSIPASAKAEPPVVVETPRVVEQAVVEQPSRSPLKRPVMTHRRLKPAESAPVVKDVPEPKPDSVVQLLTDDPNVVIYWLIDQTGGF